MHETNFAQAQFQI